MPFFFPQISPLYFLVSAIPLPIFWYFTKLRLRSILLGMVALIIAYYIELYEEILMGGSGLFIMLVFLAPAIEETAKFLMTIWKKDMKTSVGVGVGFAILENTIYYTSLSPMVGFETLFIFREFQDPILHSTTTSISVKSWKGLPWIFLSIGMHSLYNFISISDNLYEMIGISGIYLSILSYMMLKTKIKK